MALKKLIVKKSTLPGAGKGLFTLVALKKGEQIAEYRGKHRKWKEAKHEDGYNVYLLRINRTTVIDGRLSRAKARYANDAQGLTRIKNLRNNAEFVTYGKQCFIEATRKIEAGEEILVNYGREFWQLQARIKKAREQADAKR